MARTLEPLQGAAPCTAEARARRRTTLALHKPAQVHPGQPQRPQLFGNGRVFDELTIAANSSSTHVPRLGRRSSCPLLRLTGYPPQQRDGTNLGGSPTPQVRPLLTISARAGGAYDVGRSSKNLHETRGNSAAAFLARCWGRELSQLGSARLRGLEARIRPETAH